MSGPGRLLAAWRERRRARREARRKKGPKDHWIRETLETVATAVIMALVVRHFAIEAFKIPTESMSPTLYGEIHGEGAGDRILVNKYPLYWRDPERWAIVVFRYPLDTSQNYVKRLAGLPGDLLEIRDGDVWIDGHIERKPPGVQGEVWREVWPGGLPAVERDAWQADDPSAWRRTKDGWRVEAEGVRRLEYERRPVELVNHRTIRAAITDRYRGQPATGAVGDLRLRMTCHVEEGSGAVTLVIVEHEHRYAATLGVDGGSRVDVNGEVVDLPAVRLARGEDVDVSFENVDDAVELHVDGDAVLRKEYETDGSGGVDTCGLEIEVRDAKVRLEDVAVDRDIFYCDPSPQFLTRIRIPPRHFVMLGDNSSNSKDGRLWQEIVFLRKDGTWIRAEDERPDLSTGRMGRNRRVHDGSVSFVDVQGLERTIPLGDLVGTLPPDEPFGNARLIRLVDGTVLAATTDSIRTESGELRFRDARGQEQAVGLDRLVVPDIRYLGHAPFVTRDQILGEAFFVFWPAWPPARFRLRFL